MFDVETFVEDCKAAVAERAGPLAVRDLVARAVSDPAAVLEGLGEPTEAGFQPLYRDDDLTILNFAWAPLMSLLPHDHNGMWAVIGLYSGREDNIFWRRTEETIETSGAEALSTGEVTVLGGNVVHSVLNPIRKMTLALHVYGGDFFAPGRSEWDPETLVRRPFDVEASARLFAEANARFAAGAAAVSGHQG
jgi:predicted metal-dependent enzyme (double-stranded beta helix superfamily)